MKNRPFLKWAGGKYRIIDEIIKVLPPGRRLIEPFTGSAAVFMNAEFPSYLLGETNLDLINLYRYAKEESEQFIHESKSLFTPQFNEQHHYYQLRKTFNAEVEPYKRSVLFLYMNRHGYNGLCRYNQSGKYNVPFGKYIKPYFPEKELLYFSEKSQAADFFHGDFRQTFALAKKNDVIYCDPPYVPLSKTADFTNYTLNRFNQQDQEDLAELAIEASNKGISVIISNHDTAYTRALYQKASILSIPVRRHISCNGGQRLLAMELIAIFHPK